MNLLNKNKVIDVLKRKASAKQECDVLVSWRNFIK